MDPGSRYEEKRRTVALLEKLTAEAKRDLLREDSKIRAPLMEASAEGVLISEVLGIFLFLFLLIGMVAFFHKETRCAAQLRQGLWTAGRSLWRRLRRRLCGFDRHWDCQQEEAKTCPQPSVFRRLPETEAADGAAPAAAPPSAAPFDHRAELLEVFADLELVEEAVRASRAGRTGQAAPLSGQVAPLRGILRPPSSFHRHGRHRHHHHRHGRCDPDDAHGDVTAGPGPRGGAVLRHDSYVTPELNGGADPELNSDVTSDRSNDVVSEQSGEVAVAPADDIPCCQEEDSCQRESTGVASTAM